MKIIVIGAGIFGVTTALTLSENGYDVTLVECENNIMTKASKCNHNRLHFGFHYPRSIKTAKQSLDGYDLFYIVRRCTFCLPVLTCLGKEIAEY